MTWNDITVEQYQAVAKLIAEKDVTDVDKEVNVMCLLLDMSPKQVDELLIDQYKKKAKGIAFIFGNEIEGKPRRFIKANGKTFFVNYKIEKQRFGQYIESVTYGADHIENLHLLMASIVQPVKKRIGFKFIQKNDSTRHEEIANDMLKARFIDVYHAAVFFYRVYRGSIKVMKGYLVAEMVKKGMTNLQALQTVTTSINAMDGFITPKWLPTLRISA